MIRFNRIDHVAMAVPDAEAQARLFEGLFGFQRTGEWQNPDEGAHGIVLAIPGDGTVSWEVVEPHGDASPLAAFLETPRGPGIHHLALHVPDLTETRRELQDLAVAAFATADETKLILPADGPGEGIEVHLHADPLGHVGSHPVSEAPADEQPNLGIIALDHVCTAYADRDVLSSRYERLFGMEQIWRTPDGAWPDFGDCVLEIPGGQLHWEVIQPVGSESFIDSFLEKRGPAVHHVAFQVADFDAALAACEARGVPTFDEHDDETDGARWRDAFVHPRHTGGLLAQIYWEEEPGVWERSDKVRPAGWA